MSCLRVIVKFSVDGDIRFISHRDMMRMFSRALARADLPIRFSEGFNPRPRLSLVLPRPVGVASDDEMLLLDFTEAVATERIEAGLADQLPDGIALLQVEPVDSSYRPRVRSVRYTLPLEPDQGQSVGRKVAEMLNAELVSVTRQKPGERQQRQRNIRRYIEQAGIDRHGQLYLELLVADDGTARPAELLEWLGLPAKPYLAQLRRTCVQYA